MSPWYEPLLPLLLVLIGAGTLSAAFWWWTRCRHPNPHYVRADREPAHYVCYECGRSWVARQRDPAWRPSRVAQKFIGHDERKAAQAARRAAMEEARRRQLAVSRGGAAAAPAGRRRTGGQVDVVDITSRRPA